jgi:hypothetical protein
MYRGDTGGEKISNVSMCRKREAAWKAAVGGWMLEFKDAARPSKE